MDLIVWTRVIAPLAILIFVIYVVISANRLDKQIRQQKADAKYQVKTPIVTTDIDPDVKDDFDGVYPLPEELEKKDERSEVTELQRVSEKINKEIEKATGVDETSGSPPPIPVDSPSKLPSRPIPITSLFELSHQTFRDGIILSEILGRPKCLRGR
ncbi:hypothetical protein F4083_06495 [Candidatus Poribacteria bacterium]|nr:hypothetical protein [Candidatus Poribacteria bacterium]MYB65924.1 hypothetical protein [Candidatus Poribacteria bacterium]MYF56207.1 hypothetical protein [Candidatus Poribacteria bacterium]MYI93959.1 hypothetical protein [Candidatus Poribacteria bacterium]